MPLSSSKPFSSVSLFQSFALYILFILTYIQLKVFNILIYTNNFWFLSAHTKIDLREIGCDGMDWIDLAQDRDQWRALVNTVMNLRVP
jgi:hypothetical protein